MEETTKFEVICQLQGYGSWNLIVYDGDWSYSSAGLYTINVKSGRDSFNELSNVKFMFPIEHTMIKEKLIFK